MGQRRLSPRGARILIVGPDGSGKSTVSAAIRTDIERCGLTCVSTHFLPRTRSGTPVADPHGRSEHPRPVGLARLLIRYLQFARGFVTVWKRRDATLVLAERGWFDQAVDPRRYRLHPAMTWAVLALGRFLPRFDSVVVCSGDAGVIAARKPELDRHEVARQLRAWDDLATRAGRVVIQVDTTEDTHPTSAGTSWADTLALIAHG